MKLQILKLILWPKNGGEYRVVKFEPGVVNVIAGASKAGKSAVIPIIDYCLGSEHCAIPVGTIRKTCSWFGILVDTDEGLKLLARPEPGRKRASDEMFILEGDRVFIPTSITRKNTTRDGVKDILNRLSGLPNTGFDGDVGYGFKNKPSFRDLMAFTFQPQNIVANPDVLFYKADTFGHREKLKAILPFILGAVDEHTLRATWEIGLLKRQLKQLQAELTAMTNASLRLQSEARGWYHKARDFGLVAPSAQLSEQWPEAIEQLKAVLVKSSVDASPTFEGVEKTISLLTDLKARDDLFSTNLFVGKQKLQELEQLTKDAGAYLKSLETMKDRLSLSTWLKALSSAQAPNIFASSALSASEELNELCGALEVIEQIARQTPVVSASVDHEIVRLRNSVRSDTEELEAIRVEIRAIEDMDGRVKAQAMRMADIDRYLGRLDEAVIGYTKSESGRGLKDKISEVQGKIDELEPQISADQARAKTRKLLDIISDHCAKITPHLDAEWKEARISLSITDLAIKVRHDGRDDYLWEVGSGANWLAYHVAMMLGLQKLFMSKKTHHPVPHLLVFDQPSQVYFPVKRADKDYEVGVDLNDEDRAAVRKVFAAMGHAVTAADGKLQIIVLDHAGAEVWGEIPGVFLTEEWRGKKLVPPEFEVNV